MATTRISTDHPDLTPVLGPLGDDQPRILELLEEADAELADAREHLVAQDGTWNTEGVVLTSEVSGQLSIDFNMEEGNGKLIFEAQLRPRNFFPSEEAMWSPGRPPLIMATDAWDVDGGVSVRFRTRVANRPYTILEQVVELEEERYDTALTAVEAFAKACKELAALVRSREATVEAWKPETAS